MSVNALYRTQHSEIFCHCYNTWGIVFTWNKTPWKIETCFYLVWRKELACALDALYGGELAARVGQCKQGHCGGGSWPYLKHARASVEHCLAHLRGKCMQDLLQGRKRDEFSDRVASCIDLGEICGAQVSKC